ncbi:hypothetical protein [Leifsonia sp. Leaf264]|uniref:hypothetical protein n=1 Tax=Leifsonia sp. Leaf264 TaxID=1736314 RepID=UPI0007007388|nr:hypothetical protein [Leifsonia sp. Leaf264]KQO98710.1 hypothetical protein ASF30_11650 [Leifsonia sp. Leaf264]
MTELMPKHQQRATRRFRRSTLVLAALAVAGVAITGAIAVNAAAQSAADAASQALTAQEQKLADANNYDDWVRGEDTTDPANEPPINPYVKPGEANQKRWVDEPIPAAGFDDGIGIVDSTSYTFTNFQVAASAVSGADVNSVTVEADTCLAGWAAKTLPERNHTASIGVEEVCGRDAIVLVGGYSVTNNDLMAHAIDGKEKDVLAPVLKSDTRFAYASVATTDGRGILIVAAPGAGTGDPSGLPGH